MSEHSSPRNSTVRRRLRRAINPDATNTSAPQLSSASALQQLTSTPDVNPDAVMQLQTTIGNRATRSLVQSKPALSRLVIPGVQRTPDLQRDSHGKGCRCTACSGGGDVDIQAKRVLQRVDEHEEDIQAMRIQRVDEHEEDIQAMRLLQRLGEKVKPKSLAEQVDEATLDSVENIKAFLETDLKKLLRNKAAMTALAAKITVKDFLDALGQIGGIPLKKQLEPVYDFWTGVTLADVQTAIDATTQDERDGVWKSRALMKAAKKNMGTDDYLNMLPVLRVFKKAKTAEDKKSHTRADKADEHIRNYLEPYVEEAVKAGRQVQGQVAVVDGKDWKDAYDREFGNDGQEDTTNAFVDQQGLIWVHKRRGNAGTIIHEGVHKYSNGDFLSEVGFNFNEGVTEYFTRLVTKELKYKRGNYQSNFEFAEKLADYVGKDKLAKGYFDGAWVDVKDEFETKSGETWADLKTKVTDGDWGDAEDLLK